MKWSLLAISGAWGNIFESDPLKCLTVNSNKNYDVVCLG